MRKLVILCLAVGLALASSGQWIGRSENPHYTIPDPQPGIFPFTPALFTDAADTLKYDDNMAANAWCQNVVGGGWGIKFISPGDNVTLAGALINFYSGWPVPGGTKALVKAYADDGINGAPGTELWASDTVTITMGQWNFVPISVPVVASNFYIFYEQVDVYPNCPGLSIDANNNAPAHRKWALSGGGFSEDATYGDWLIRAVLDWTPQDVNASAVWFATNMPKDTLPNINFQIRAEIKNMGNDTLPVGTPVRLDITGPSSYEYQDTVLTTAKLARGALAQMNFSPAWHIPNQPGSYHIEVWTEAAGEQWPANDTITYDLSCAKWVEYYTEAAMHWVTWAAPMRATQFNPADFSVPYPVGLSRVRADFYLAPPPHAWPDSSFQFMIYGDDGSELLYESETLEALPGTPGAFKACDLDSMLIFPSGTFYVAVVPVSSTGYPSSCGDSSAGGHSYYGTPGGWTPWIPTPGQGGELFISASIQGNVGIEEGYEPGVTSPSLRITNYPNPVTDLVTLKWQVPNRMPLSVNLYDATGRMMRNLYTANDKARVGTLTMDTKALAAGIYLVRLETAKGSATRKLVIDR
jgi:hypothetical protein